MLGSFNYKNILIVLIAIFCYVFLGYFFERVQFVSLFLVYSILFVGTIVLLKDKQLSTQKLFYIGLLFRVVFLFSIPFLSQDFYRFIWDGRLAVMGISPYEYKPAEIINSLATFSQATDLYQGMGALSASHYSNYPPVNQMIFVLAALLSAKSILGSTIFFRIIIILADIGIFYFGQKMLQYFNQDKNKIFWYFLNPLVIIELTGNLHFEGVMLFFLVLGFYFLMRDKWLWACGFITISISIKLLPLLLLPLFWQKLGLKRSLIFYPTIIISNFILFIPFFSYNLVENYIKTISLWFINFEFNASIYYLIREIGFYYKGYNIIGTFGKIIPFVIVTMVLFFAFFRKNNTLEKVISSGLIVLSLYFFTATTVHPWYVINLIVLGVFTRYKFWFVWSFLVILSYYAYSVFLFHENKYLLLIEYGVVLGVFLYEIITIQNQKFK
jgi:alpha-1,6-mannosyltransferase